MRLSGKDIYATIKASIYHVLDLDFLYGIARSDDADYIYTGADRSVIVNLASISNQWEVIAEMLSVDGFDSDGTPYMMNLFEQMARQDIFHIEFHRHHPKLKNYVWFTPDSFMELKPLQYDAKVFSYNELSEEQKKLANTSMKLISYETLNAKNFISLGTGRIVKLDEEEIELTEPEEIQPDCERLILTETGERFAIKVNEDNMTASVAMVMN